MYLFNYEDDDRTSNYIDEVLDRHGLQVMDFHGSSAIRSMLTIGPLGMRLSEFPGNCSMLILHNIQDFFAYEDETTVRNYVEACKEICFGMRYAGLIITTTMESFENFLKDSGFSRVITVFNPHSFYDNYFMMWSTGIKEEDELE